MSPKDCQEIGQLLLSATDEGEGATIPGVGYIPEARMESFVREAALEIKRRIAAGIFVVVLSLVPAAAEASSSMTAKPRDWQGVVVHITDSERMTAAECDAWHRGRGWDACGYNFVIEPDGAIYNGRGMHRVGAHVAGQNSKYLGVAFVSKDAATPEQIAAFLKLYRRIAAVHGRLTIFPHSKFAAKRCPGHVLEQLAAVGRGR